MSAADRPARKPRIATLVTVRWCIEEPARKRGGIVAFERLMRKAVRDGLVRTWDDGRSRDPWYEARRGPAERSLREKCIVALGHAPCEVRP